ncbi:MAG: hypothetical protein AAF513_03650 [Pseudomonadota bacterium]
MQKTAVSVLCIATLCGCGVPMGPIAGGKLDGEIKPWPESWAFTDNIENILLETRPDDPYSVTLWCVQDENALYIGSNDSSSNWIRFIDADSDVVLSVEGHIYPARAERVEDPVLVDALQQAFTSKYEIEDPTNFFQSDGVLFALSPR